jgi:hypothetical protein
LPASCCCHLKVDLVIRIGTGERPLFDFNETRAALKELDLMPFKQEHDVVRTHDDFAKRLALPGEDADPRLAPLANENLVPRGRPAGLGWNMIVRQRRAAGIAFSTMI